MPNCSLQFNWSHPDVFSPGIRKVSSVKTQLIYCQLKWRHVSAHSHNRNWPDDDSMSRNMSPL
jgi:hypothetical protein